jgi:alkylation response protein AidB-like acyl-CoA dehydrogenase
MLEKEPEQRYAGLRELCGELRQTLEASAGVERWEANLGDPDAPECRTTDIDPAKLAQGIDLVLSKIRAPRRGRVRKMPEVYALAMGRVMDEAKAGNETGAVSSMLKYYGTELNKRRAELAMSISGTDGLKFDGQAQADIAPVWLRTKANSIEGGTSEVQLNIIAKNVLRLPGA